MKRFTAILGVILAASLSMSCAMLSLIGAVRGDGKLISETRLGSNAFSSVSTEGIAAIIATEASACSVVIEAESNLMPYITTEIDGTTLKIGIKPNTSIIPTAAMTIRITAPSYVRLSSSGTGNISVGPVAASKDLAVALTGTGSAAVSGDFSSLNLNITGTGGATLTGTSNSLTASLLGVGNLEAYDMPIASANLVMTGTGNARIRMVNGSLTYSLTGIGDIEYKGTIINPSGSGSGIGKLINRN